jgi:hypothetical protein
MPETSRRLAEALENVEIAFLQLEFAIKLMNHVELDKLDPRRFDEGEHIVDLGAERLEFRRAHFDTKDKLGAATEVCFKIALGASALALDEAFKAAGFDARHTEAKDNVGRLCILVYMVRCAYAHGVAEPRWEVTKGKFRRSITVSADGAEICLDLAPLHGQALRPRTRHRFTELVAHPG